MAREYCWRRLPYGQHHSYSHVVEHDVSAADVIVLHSTTSAAAGSRANTASDAPDAPMFKECDSNGWWWWWGGAPPMMLPLVPGSLPSIALHSHAGGMSCSQGHPAGALAGRGVRGQAGHGTAPGSCDWAGSLGHALGCHCWGTGALGSQH